MNFFVLPNTKEDILKKVWRKFVTRLFWGTIDFHSRKKKYYGSQWCPRTVLFTTFFRISFFVFSRTKTFIQVWNYLRVSTWWQNFHFWVNYPFKDIFRVGLNEPIRSQLPGGKIHWSLERYIDYALLLAGSPLTVGVADEEPRNCAELAPEHFHVPTFMSGVVHRVSSRLSWSSRVSSRLGWSSRVSPQDGHHAWASSQDGCHAWFPGQDGRHAWVLGQDGHHAWASPCHGCHQNFPK